jgi:excinuclease UvrABC nuclease subunit
LRGIAAGAAVIRAALRSVPASPGVYRMLDRKGDAVYVGKARNLKSRVQNYAHPAGLSNRLRRMVSETAAMDIVVTGTEAEALLLECNLIKRLMPRYNVLLRDDKSFPLIHITADHEPISARSPRRARSTAPSSHCRRRFCCAPAATASSRRAPGLACCTRSSAAARPASAASTAPPTRH